MNSIFQPKPVKYIISIIALLLSIVVLATSRELESMPAQYTVLLIEVPKAVHLAAINISIIVFVLAVIFIIAMSVKSKKSTQSFD
ncbi:hypothetical protein ACFL96_08440 [Thermoproteota archaeon]